MKRVGYFHPKDVEPTLHVAKLKGRYPEPTCKIYTGASLVDAYQRRCRDNGERFAWDTWARRCAEVLDVVVIPDSPTVSRGTANVVQEALRLGKRVEMLGGYAVERVYEGRSQWEWEVVSEAPSDDDRDYDVWEF